MMQAPASKRSPIKKIVTFTVLMLIGFVLYVCFIPPAGEIPRAERPTSTLR